MNSIGSKAGRLAAIAATGLLAIATATGCGGDDNTDNTANRDGGGANQTADQTADQTTEGRGAEAAAVRKVYQGIEQAIADANPKGVCAAMTAQARAKTATARPQAKTCEQYVKLVMTNARERIPPRLIDIEIDGNQATALVRVADNPPYGIPFIKQQDQWKTNQPLGVQQ